MPYSKFLVAQSNDDNLSDRWFFAMLARGTGCDAYVQNILTSTQFCITLNDIMRWAERTRKLINNLDSNRLVVRWLHCAALQWSAFAGNNSDLDQLEIDISQTYLKEFGNRIPSGWHGLFRSFNSRYADPFSDDIKMPAGHDLYILTHQILVRSNYFNHPFRLSKKEERELKNRLYNTMVNTSEIADIDLECFLILWQAELIESTIAVEICDRSLSVLKRNIDKQDLIALREQYHFLLLHTLLTGMLHDIYNIPAQC